MSVNTIFSVSNAVSILERALVFLNAGTQHSKPHSAITIVSDEVARAFP